MPGIGKAPGGNRHAVDVPVIFNLLYLALLGTHVYWHIWANPVALPLLIVSTIPLLLALPWLLFKGGHRVRSATALMTLFYFVYAMMEAVAVPQLRQVAVIQVGLCVGLYISLILSKRSQP